MRERQDVVKIAIIASGTRGDVQPYLALGRAFRAAGHDVRFVTSETFGADVRAEHLSFTALPGDVRDVMNSPELKALLDKGRFVAIQRHAAKLVRDAAPAWARAALSACEGCDVLLAGLGGLLLARALSEKLRVPLIEAHLVPFTPTRAFPAPLMPPAVGRLGGVANRFSYRLMEAMMWAGFREADAIVRRDVLRLPTTAKRTAYDAPVLYGVSPRVVTRPPDWPANVHLTGFWFLDPPAQWTPPAALAAFLASGTPPVSIGFGSMVDRDAAATSRVALAALERVGARAVLLSGWADVEDVTLPDHVFRIEAVPHAWLFDRVSAVVHHGGAGTTAAGLRGGVPNVVVPFFGDQPYWGRRVAALDVGPAPVFRRALDASRLASALREALTNEAMRAKAKALGTAIRAEEGAAHAVRIVETFARSRGLDA
ncbi:glycosyltransferase [Deinococcus yavapaiensis]|uniref:UDP:flavonoid glycosyltransferase YjiC (YdhE family) n=1 Tax=Deinococcus yavapaiensis KR-236 TaxID=694435 RepID=A0A318SNE2_9DEIO|nr:nucleotide disphospho-sugar-binding domain-containing protein [Deinococcus yavapaiensis]PYE56422.1 UDP:flavonoid glycosyltransferase YjiC (YdhE family) [Deinococcus yavapaiensis KR-236]